jgi:hypothetical protein
MWKLTCGNGISGNFSHPWLNSAGLTIRSADYFVWKNEPPCQGSGEIVALMTGIVGFREGKI